MTSFGSVSTIQEGLQVHKHINVLAQTKNTRLVGAGGGHSTHHGSIPIGSNLVSNLLGAGVWDRVGQLI
jgi:hypothetical protein